MQAGIIHTEGRDPGSFMTMQGNIPKIDIPGHHQWHMCKGVTINALTANTQRVRDLGSIVTM